MFILYQNRYSNYLNLNLIKVKYADNRTIVDSDFSIRLSKEYKEEVNDLIVFKLHLFLGASVWEKYKKCWQMQTNVLY